LIGKRKANGTTRNITKREVNSKTKLLSTCYISHLEFLHVQFLSVLKDSHSNERAGTHGVTTYHFGGSNRAYGGEFRACRVHPKK